MSASDGGRTSEQVCVVQLETREDVIDKLVYIAT